MAETRLFDEGGNLIYDSTEVYYKAQGTGRERTFSITIGTDSGGWSFYDAIDNNIRYHYGIGIEDLTDEELAKIFVNEVSSIDIFDQDHDALRLDLVLGKELKIKRNGE